ncbi:TonB-dependent receptor [Ferruginibacter sp. HRS2-29]|uniref:TonB-dependent receptor n=1 Tax=Ferruginibacter sp. HRS2-29 TaxID=2487334 RepID=UPI0020CBC140|nr:TonB-dependent receptor [Ferruginibacter sp. HRS2-29]MCP9752180.1 TonB-dependent receptor [Ferruginibacter sp. HRS2-29]
MGKLLLLIGFLFSGFISTAQNSITGTITTSDGQKAAMVNVQVKGQNGNTTHSDSKGNYSLTNISGGKSTIVVSFVGLKTQEKTVDFSGAGPAVLNFILSENAQELEEVIVSAKKGLNAQPVSVGKVNINPMDLPQSIAVIGQTVIRDQQSQRLSDVIKNVNGVYLSTTRGSTQESFSARGYAFSSTNMFKNGSRVNSGVMPEVSSLEKVEILKGSAAILYGNVSPGGIINMVTKQPKFNYGGEFSIRSGSYGLIKPSFDVYGPLSKTIAFRVNGTYERADSYRDKVQSKRFYINPSVLFKLGKRTELLLQADYLDTDFTPDFGIGSLNNTKIADVPRSAFFGTSWQYNKAKQTTATATVKHDLNNNWNINFTGSYQQYKRDYYSTERIQADADGDWGRPLNKILSTENYVIGQVDLKGKFNTGKIVHTLLAGVDADNYSTTSFTFNNPTLYDSLNILNPGKFVQRTDIPAANKVTKAQTPLNRMGIYVQDLISLSAKFKLLAGLRWSQQESRPVTTTYLLKDSIAKGIRKKDDAFSPRVGLVYKPSPIMSVFASYANSFSVNSGTDVFNNALSPSIIDQYEIGIKNDFFKGKLSANLTFYKIINNNLAQTAQFAADGITPNNNTALKELVGETTSDGIELDISSQPVKGLNILAGYSYNNMRYTDIKPGKGNYIEGERLVNTPAHTANSSIFYTFQKGKVTGLKIGAAAFYTGKRFGGWNNTQQQVQTYSRLIPVDGFTTVDISAGYTFSRISLLAKVSNLFNTYNYYVHENYSINPIAPRQVIGTIAIKL